MAQYPQDLPTDKYKELWDKYKKYVLSDPMTRVKPPSKKGWEDIEKSFKRTPLRVIYGKIEESTNMIENKKSKRRVMLENRLRSVIRPMVRQMLSESNQEDELKNYGFVKTNVPNEYRRGSYYIILGKQNINFTKRSKALSNRSEFSKSFENIDELCKYLEKNYNHFK